MNCKLGNFIQLTVYFFITVNCWSQNSIDFESSRLNGCPPFQTSFKVNGLSDESLYWDFGNGETSTSIAPSVTFHNPGLYSVTLIVKGKQNSDTITKNNFIQVFNKPQLDFTIETTGLCSNNNSLSIKNKSKYADSYVWDFGDGSNSKLENPKHQYKSSGTHYISLLGKNNHGCSNTLISKKSIVINPSPISNFTVNSSKGCGEDFKFSFKNLSSNSSIWNWEFSEGSTANIKDPEIIFHSTGNISVKLISSNSYGCKDSIFKSNFLQIYPKTEAIINLDTTQGCTPLKINISNSNKAVKHITWDFGDGTIKEGLNVQHIYSKSGKYKVKLALIDSNNCAFDNQVSRTISAFSPPWAKITTNSKLGCLPMNIWMEATSSNKNLKYNWDLGDGTLSNKKSFHHIYKQTGKFNPNLKITTPEGCTNIIKSPTIQVVTSVANFELDEKNGCAPLVVNFTNKSESASSYFWNFGDGSNSNDKNPFHSFEKAGVYNISLTTKNDFGCTDTFTVDSAVIVSENPVSIHNPKEIFACSPLEMSFMPGALGTDSWHWELSDGTKYTEKNPTHSFKEAGDYTISLSSKTNNGCYFKIDKFANIKIENPKANFEVEYTCDTYDVKFINHSENAVKYIWDFGNTISSSEFEPIYSYDTIGWYSPKLTAISKNGCASTKSMGNGVDFFQCIADSSIIKIIELSESEAQDSIITTIQNNFNLIKGCLPLTIQFRNYFKDAKTVFWDFGDGNSSNEKKPFHTYEEAGVYSITYIATDSLDNKIKLEFENKVIVGGISANFNFQASSDCNFSALQFVDQSEGKAAYWQWAYQDSLLNFDQNPVINFEETNTVHPISLLVRDSVGCTDKTYRTVYIGKPQYRFIKPDKICFGDSAKFKSGKNEDYDLIWHFGDSNTSNEKSPSHLYSVPGVYNVSAEVQFNNGCNETINIGTVEVWGPSSAISTLSSQFICPGDKFYVQALEENGDHYKWWVDNAKELNKTGKKISWQLEEQGFHDLSIIVTKGQCSSTKTYKNIIKVHELKVDYQLSQDGDCFPIKAHLTNTSKDVVSAKWDFGDGDSSTDINTTHLYNYAPDDSIKLTITNINGCSGTIINSKIKFLTSKFKLSNERGCAPFKIDLKSEMDSTGKYNWKWDFGDGNYSSQPNPNHTYLDTGTFSVSLSVSSDLGCTEKTTLNKVISVSKIISDFKIKEISNSKCAPLVVEFENKSKNSSQWKWLFGDENESLLESPIHFYTKPGNYVVKLISNNEIGCIDTFISNESIFVPGPKVNFEIEDSAACTFQKIKLKNLSSGFDSLLWNFGDGIESTKLNPYHIFNEEKSFTITLWAKDSAGCTSFHAITKPISFLPKPKASFLVEDTTGCSPYKSKIKNLSKGYSNLRWIIGKNDTINGKIDHLSIPSPGKYNISLVAKSKDGCADTANFNSVIVKPSPEANFHSNITQGCGPNQKVELINTSTYHGESNFQWFVNNNPISTDTNALINLSPGKHSISLAVENEYKCVDTVNKKDHIEIFDTITPTTSKIEILNVLNDNSIEIKWEPSFMTGFSSYNLYRKDSSDYVLISNIEKVSQTSIIDDKVNTKKQSYSYKLTTTSLCNKTSELQNSIKHSTIHLNTVNSGKFNVNVSWNHYEGKHVDNYNLYRNGILIGKDLSPLTLNFVDTTAYCNKEYNYEIKATLKDSSRSNSNLSDLFAKGLGTDDQLANVLSASVINDNGVEIKWEIPEIGKEIIDSYLIYASTTGENFEIIGKTNSNISKFYTTRTDVLTKRHFFKIKTVNTCNLVSNLGKEVSTILLNKNKINHLANLTWTAVKGWDNNQTHFQIQQLDEYGNWINQGQKFTNSYQSTFEFLKPNLTSFTYRIIGTNGSQTSISNTVSINENYNLYIPNTFTPNGDGLNDKFMAYGTGISNFNMIITNRQGVKVFESNNIELGWDGTIDGSSPTPQIFYYAITISDQSGNNNITKQGTAFLAK